MIEYMKSRIKILKDSRDKYNQYSDMYCAYDSIIDELKFTILLHSKEVVNNVRSSDIIEDTINKAKLI
jgi:hypothetical protein